MRFRKWMPVALALLGMFLLAACSTEPQDAAGQVTDTRPSVADAAQYHKLTPQEGKQKIEQGGVAVVDVRTAEEYAQGHIPGAVLVPLDTIGSEPPARLPDKDAVLLVYCRTGVRSKEAAQRLLSLGYQNIYDLGGITSWPYETQTGEGAA